MEDAPEPKGSLRPLLLFWRRHRVLAGIVCLILLADQVTKELVATIMQLGESIPPDGPIRITYTYNTGAAFGLFQNQTIPLIIASIVGIGIVLWIYRAKPQLGPLFKVSIGLQLGGAIGNLINRVTQGKVVDFIDVGPWPVFNLADSSIVTGLIMLIWIFVIREPQKAKGEQIGKSDSSDN